MVVPGWDDVALGILIHVGDTLLAGGAISEALNRALPGLPPADLQLLDRLAKASKAEVTALRGCWLRFSDEEKAAHMGAILAGWKRDRGR